MTNMTILMKQKIKHLLNQLKDAGVYNLGYDFYNELNYSERYRKEYETLFADVVCNILFTHYNIDPLFNNTRVDSIGQDEGQWYIFFDQPKLMVSIDRILDENFNGLDSLKKY